MNPNTALEREEARALVTSITTGVLPGRHGGGTPYHLHPDPMRIISTNIPVYQPDGRLSIPPDDVAELRTFVEAAGGSLDFDTVTKCGFIFGTHRGLPVYELAISLADDVDQAAFLERLDVVLRAIISRNLLPITQTQPA